MKNRKNFLQLLAVLAIVLIAAAVIYNTFTGRGLNTPSGDSRTPAPDFTVYDEQGEPLRLSELEGRPVILNFWASWCGPCRSEMPELDRSYAENGTDIAFLIVNVDDGGAASPDVAGFLDEGGYSFPVYYDTDNEASAAYGVSAIPATYFIDADGDIAAQLKGAADAGTLAEGIDMIR